MPTPARRMDPAKLPAELREFLPIFEEYGIVESDSALYAKLDEIEADAKRFAQLEDFLRRFTPEKQTACTEWLTRQDIGKSHEAAKVYFFLGLLADLEMPALGDAPPPDLVEHALEQLRTFDTVSARADRMFAAQSLGERGRAVATRAAESLRTATSDRAPEVAAWAHAALVLVTGADEPAHRAAIRRLIELCDEKSIERMYAESALEELDKPPAVRDLGRLCGACILNDLETIREVVGRVDVNARDHNRQAPIEYAVGNAHPEALQLLLEAGADPNTRTRHGQPVLSDAATRRKGVAMIPLLLEHGADVNARDRSGATPLTCALDHHRPANANLLRKHGGTT